MVINYLYNSRYFNNFKDAVEVWLKTKESTSIYCESWFKRLNTIEKETKEEWCKEALTDIMQFHCQKYGVYIIKKQNYLMYKIGMDIKEIKCYSDYWRVNRSPIQYIELENIMKSLRRVVGYLGLKCKVKWVTRLPNNFKDDLIEVPLKLAI